MEHVIKKHRVTWHKFCFFLKRCLNTKMLNNWKSMLWSKKEFKIFKTSTLVFHLFFFCLKIINGFVLIIFTYLMSFTRFSWVNRVPIGIFILQSYLALYFVWILHHFGKSSRFSKHIYVFIFSITILYCIKQFLKMLQ